MNTPPLTSSLSSSYPLTPADSRAGEGKSFFFLLPAGGGDRERKEGRTGKKTSFLFKKTSLFWYGGQVAPLRTATHAVCAAPARRRENGRRGWKFKEISAAPDWPHLKFNPELRGPDFSLSCVLWSSGLLTFPDASDRSSRNLKQEVKIHKNTAEEMNQTKDQMFFCSSLTCTGFVHITDCT